MTALCATSVLVTLLVGNAAPQPDAPLRLTLSRAVEVMLERNGELQVAQLSVAAATVLAESWWGTYLPTASAGFGWQEERSDPRLLPFTRVETLSTAASIAGALPDAGLEYRVTLYNDTLTDSYVEQQRTLHGHIGTWEVSATAHLLRGLGPLVGSLERDELRGLRALAAARQSVTHLDLLFELFRAYTAAYVTQEQHAATARYLEAAAANLARFERLHAVGQASRLQVLNAQAQRLALEGSATSLLAAKEQAQANLMSLLGSSLGSGVVLAAPPSIPAAEVAAAPVEAPDGVLAANPLLVLARAQEALAEIALARARNDVLPELDVVATLAGGEGPRSELTRFLPQTSTTFAVLGLLSVPVGLVTERAKLAAQEAQLAAAEAALVYSQRRVGIEWQAALEQVRSAERGLELAQTLYEVAQERYRAVRPLAEGNDLGQQLFFDVETAMINAALAYERAKAEVAVARLAVHALRGDIAGVTAMLQQSR